MALPDPRFIESPSLQNIFLNKDDGTLLSAGVVTFYRDVERTVLKPIYQQVRLPDNTYDFVALNNPVTLTSIGTYGSNTSEDINVYLYPFTGAPTDTLQGDVDLYYITVYSSDGILELTREAWPPNVASISNVDTFSDSENQIENPQFIETFLPFTDTQTYSVSGSGMETIFAPNWSVITTGTGTVTIGLEDNTDITMPTGAPFAIILNSSGITSLQLRQRFLNSPRLFQNSYVSASLVANSQLGNNVQITMDYVPSSGISYNLMSGIAPSTGNYVTLLGPTVLIASNNADGGLTGYVDIIISIPVLAKVGITSVQALTVRTADDSSEFQQESSLRQADHLFNYYEAPLKYKPIPSWLVGWDFPLNPAQWGATVAASAIGANKSFYAWDQTIVFQSANSGIAVSRSNSGSLVLTANATTQTAIIQYLDVNTTRDILHNRISSYIEHDSNNPNGLTATVSLWYTTDANLPDMTTNNSLVLTLDANGKPASFNGTWVEIPRGNFGNALFQITGAPDNTFNNDSFFGWSLVGQDVTNTATFMAIVIGTSSITSTYEVDFLSASLNSGDIPTRPGSQTQDEVLRECQRLYETSFLSGTAIPSATTSGIKSAQMNPSLTAGSQTVGPQSFNIEYTVPKRILPLLTIYSGTTTTPNRVEAFNISNAGTTPVEINVNSFWTATGSYKNMIFRALTTAGNLVGAQAAATANAGYIEYHYTADARFGIV